MRQGIFCAHVRESVRERRAMMTVRLISVSLRAHGCGWWDVGCSQKNGAGGIINYLYSMWCRCGLGI